MTLTTKNFRQVFVLAAMVILVAGAARADGYTSHRWNSPLAFQRFSLSLDGGFGLAEGRHGTLDAKIEFQYGLSRRIRIGLGVGYLGGGNGWGRDGEYGRRQDEQAAREMSGAEVGKDIPEMGPRRSYRIVPMNLNLYYMLPLGRCWSLFASGGGGAYLGWFHGFDVRHKIAWGGQGGLGAEFRMSRRLTLIAQGEYRLAEFGRLAKIAAGTPSTMNLADPKDGDHERPLFSRVSLNGVTFHLGAKFGF